MSIYPTKKLWEILTVLRNGKSCKQLSEPSWDKITRIETISTGSINKEKVGYFELSQEDKAKYSIKKWDILFSHINSVEHVWKIAIAKKNYEDLYHWMNLLLLRWDSEKITGEFLYVILQYYFKSGYWRNICKKAINQASLNQSNIIDISVLLPPLPTQQAIVAKLDEAFARIDRSIELFRENITELEEMSKCVLKKAFNEGKFEMRRLGDVCDYMWSWFACNKNNEIPNWYVHLRTHNIWTDGKLNFNLIIAINHEMADSNKSKIYKWDILFNNTNSKELVWKTAYIEEDYDYWYSNHLTRLVINKGHYPKYISFYINFLFKKWFFQKLANKWIWQAWVNNTMLKEVLIPLPPLSVQHSIVAHLDQVFVKNKTLKSKYEEQIIELQSLKQSLLKDAFEWRLVDEISEK